MTTLVFTSRVGPTEGAIFSSCRAGGEDAVFYNTSTSELVGAGDVRAPSWLGHPFFDNHHPRAVAYFQRLLEVGDVKRVLSVGLDASAQAMQLLPDHQVTPLLFRDDLKFSTRRRAGSVHQFGLVNRSADMLVLEDPSEMDKAVGHGSVLPHVRLPGFVLSGERVLRRTGDPHVAVLVDEASGRPWHSAQLHGLVATLSGVGVETSVVDIRMLYGDRDLEMSRGLAGTMRYHLGNCSHVVILGDSPHTWAAFNGLYNDLDRVYVEDTVNSHYMYPNSWPNAARGAALGDRVRRGVVSGEAADRAVHRTTFAAEPASEWTTRLDAVRDANLPWYYEENPRLEDGVFDVFFSVAPIENRTNGARPQRIRNMAEAFQVDAPVIRLSPHPHVLRRRRAWIDHLVTGGTRVRYFYGENSTSPMHTTGAIDEVADTIRGLKAAGCRVGWFIRDIHWLSPQAEHLDLTSVEGQAMVSRGMHELRQMAEVADVFFVPCASAIVGFQRLLGEEVFRRAVTWAPLPPAVSRRNLLPAPEIRTRDERLTLVYSGGVGGFYNLDMYVEAVAGLQQDVRMDFVVRREDVPRLSDLLAQNGIDISGDSVTVRTGNFADYVPTTLRAVSVALLDTDYGRLTFPYKVMSALERRIPVLAFEGTDYGDFITREGVGYTCGPTPDSIRAAILEALRDDRPAEAVVQDDTITRHTWEARAQEVRDALASAATFSEHPSAADTVDRP